MSCWGLELTWVLVCAGKLDGGALVISRTTAPRARVCRDAVLGRK